MGALISGHTCTHGPGISVTATTPCGRCGATSAVLHDVRDLRRSLCCAGCSVHRKWVGKPEAAALEGAVTTVVEPGVLCEIPRAPDGAQSLRVALESYEGKPYLDLAIVATGTTRAIEAKQKRITIRAGEIRRVIAALETAAAQLDRTGGGK